MFCIVIVLFYIAWSWIEVSVLITTDWYEEGNEDNQDNTDVISQIKDDCDYINLMQY